MYQRPIARSLERAPRGTAVRVWGASLMAGNQRIYISTNGRKWKPLKGQRRAGNISSGVIKLQATTLVRIQDAAGKGPSRKIWVR